MAKARNAMTALRRMGWGALILLLAVVTVGTELDRESRKGDLPVALVPTPFRSFALAREAATAVKAGSAEQALELSRRLVASRPMPAENLVLLGLAEFRSNRIREGNLTVQMGARRGWRDRAAQEGMLRIAFDAGDFEEAAGRLAALWIVPESSPNLAQLTSQVLAAQPGRAALAQRLASGGYWVDNFMRGVSQQDPAAFAEVVSTAARQGARYDCAVLEAATRNLVQRNHEAEARLVWTGPCAEGHPFPESR